MAYVYNRGTRDKPNWWIQYTETDGTRPRVRTKAKTKAEAKRYAAEVESRIAKGLIGVIEPQASKTFSELMEKWLSSLTNRNKEDDKVRARKHLLPRFEKIRLKDITLAQVMRWIDAQRAAKNLSEATIRFNVNLLSRFFSWAIERGHADNNPVKSIPRGRRPVCAPKGDRSWLDSDEKTIEIFNTLPEPINFMFYLANRSGLRLGEVCGLRMSDMDNLGTSIKVRFSYDGPLKENKTGGKVKFVPAPYDASAVLDRWLEKRRAEGAEAEDFVFNSSSSPAGHFSKMFISRCWWEMRKKLGVELTWYEATRHSYVSRSLSAGASLDEVSASVGYSAPAVTRRYYDHFIRREFSPALRKGLGIATENKGEIVPLPGIEGSREEIKEEKE
jgi:integrase